MLAAFVFHTNVNNSWNICCRIFKLYPHVHMCTMNQKTIWRKKMGLEPLQQTTHQCRKAPIQKRSKICNHSNIHPYNQLNCHYQTHLWFLRRKQIFGKIDCTDYYSKIKDVLTKFTNKSNPYHLTSPKWKGKP